jgi:hypothetical protein
LLLNNFVEYDATVQNCFQEKSTTSELKMKKWPRVKSRVQIFLPCRGQSNDQNICQLFALYQVKQFIFQTS